MKLRLIGALLLTASSSAMAVAPGGPNCGWGNMLLEGKSGLANHIIAITTNGTSGNATFGMTFGTNGCNVDGELTYGGDRIAWFNNILDEYSTDVAVGHGEALTAVAVMVGIEEHDRAHFNAKMQQNFASLFPSTDTTGQQVLDTMIQVMAEDDTLSKYVS